MFEGVEVSDILKERVLRGSFRRQTSLWFVRFSLVSPPLSFFDSICEVFTL